jgi:hypothetical protein
LTSALGENAKKLLRRFKIAQTILKHHLLN